MKAKKLIVAVTGTPGTGKSVFSKELERRIKDSEAVELNDLVNEYKLYTRRDKFGTKIVRLKDLGRALKRHISKSNAKTIFVVGHLAPELNQKYDIGIVMRCGLLESARRMEKRKYPKEKIKENIVAEALDYCGESVRKRSKNVFEVETNAQRNAVLNYVKAVSSGKKAKAPAKNSINEFGELMTLIKSGNKYGL